MGGWVGAWVDGWVGGGGGKPIKKRKDEEEDKKEKGGRRKRNRITHPPTHLPTFLLLYFFASGGEIFSIQVRYQSFQNHLAQGLLRCFHGGKRLRDAVHLVAYRAGGRPRSGWVGGWVDKVNE